jgi:hypothetical protein
MIDAAACHQLFIGAQISPPSLAANNNGQKVELLMIPV